MQSLVRSLQAQLETTEEKLAKSELILLDHDRLVREERRKVKEMEKEMNVRHCKNATNRKHFRICC